MGWILEAMAKSDGTLEGVAKVMGARLAKAKEEDLPELLQGKTNEEVEKLLLKTLELCHDTTDLVANYVDAERRKGRSFDEVYEEIQPALAERTARDLAELERAAGKRRDAPEDPPEEDREENGDARPCDEEEAEEEAAYLDESVLLRRLRRLLEEFPEEFPGAADLDEAELLRVARILGDRLGEAAVLDDVEGEEESAEEEPAEGSLDDWHSGSSAGSRDPGTGELSEEDEAELDMDSLVEPCDLQEQLVLCGSLNGWDVERAKTGFRFGTTLRSTGIREGRIHVTVPPEGMAFQLLGAERGADFRIVPKGEIFQLVHGDRQAVPARIVRGEGDAGCSGRSFVIAGTGMTASADVRACLALDCLEVWSERGDEASPPKRAFLGS